MAGTWSQIDVGGQTIELFKPDRPDELRRGVLYLHDQHETTLRGQTVYEKQLNDRGLWAACPRAGATWWLDQRVEEFDAAISPLSFVMGPLAEWFQEQTAGQSRRVGLLGHEMGGQGVLQLAYRRAREFPVVAAISPAVDFQVLHGRGTVLDSLFNSPEAVRQATVTLQIHPLDWPRHQWLACETNSVWFDGVERLTSKLSSMGVPFESRWQPTQQEEDAPLFDRMAEEAIEFIASRLEQESRRV